MRRRLRFITKSKMIANQTDPARTESFRRLDDEVALGEEHLPVAVIIAAPHFLTGGGFEADEVRDVITVAVV